MAEQGKSEVFFTFARLGLYAFGGPTAHFALFRRVLSQDRGWVTPAQYDADLALCQFLPGPGSSQMAAILGWRRAGPAGAVLAMLAFALPSLVLMTAAGLALPRLDPALVQGGLLGLMAAVAAVVAVAVWAMVKTTARQPAGLVLASASTAILLTTSSLDAFSIWLQPGVIALSALGGWLILRTPPIAAFASKQTPISATGPAVALATFAILLIGLPLIAGDGDALQLADAVYRAGALVFGGGHVVLPLLEAGTVPDLVSEPDFLAGYGLAQAVPGPLFSFAAFVGAASGGSLATALTFAGLAGALIFLPGLLLVYAVLPVWTRVQANARAQGAILGAAAGATGVLAAAFVDPVLTSLPVDWRVYGLGIAAFAALNFAKAPPPLVIAVCAGAGLLVF